MKKLFMVIIILILISTGCTNKIDKEYIENILTSSDSWTYSTKSESRIYEFYSDYSGFYKCFDYNINGSVSGSFNWWIEDGIIYTDNYNFCFLLKNNDNIYFLEDIKNENMKYFQQ
ncbi:MAG: hypothetical protein IKL18_04445 [Oscillospiraceae bacterium]|nr:hypothetical protein [Oscillospiraceae bacterium]MBR6657405.1 hypothetical protein [Oscillospiraceae bacterium]